MKRFSPFPHAHFFVKKSVSPELFRTVKKAKSEKTMSKNKMPNLFQNLMQANRLAAVRCFLFS
jgi:hypothetical protein